mgnify:CR=1 FL=1
MSIPDWPFTLKWLIAHLVWLTASMVPLPPLRICAFAAGWLQPVSSSQTVQREDVLHIGGFSDAVFDLLAQFAQAPGDGSGRVERIEDMPL